MNQYYAVLGIPEFTSDQTIIRSAYRNQIKFFHPDLYGGPPEIAQIKTQQLNEAYGILRDADRKADYDASLRMEKDALQRQYDAARGAVKNSARSDDRAVKPAGSKGLSNVLSVVSVLLLLSLIAVMLLFLYGIRNYDLPLSDEGVSQSVLEKGDRTDPLDLGGTQSDGGVPSGRADMAP